MINRKILTGLLIVVLLTAFSSVFAQDATPDVTTDASDNMTTAEVDTEISATQDMMVTEEIAVTQEAAATADASREDLPDQVIISVEGLFPEGVEYDTLNQRFLVSSTADGMIRTVSDDGTTEVLVMDDRLPSTLGLEADEANNRLLVAATDMEMEGYLGIYDLTTGENINLVDFRPLTPNDPEHFVNDVAVDSEGNAYVTDSYAGVIYRVDPQGNASIFLEDESFSTQFALNGIVYNVAGNYLLAVQVPNIIKIPLDNPAAFTQVGIPEQFVGADGLALLDNRTLIIANNNPAKVFRVQSGDDFATAMVTGTFETGNVNPTTVAARQGQAYVLYSFLNAEEQVITEFPIQRAGFEDVTMATPIEIPIEMTAETTSEMPGDMTDEATMDTTDEMTPEMTTETTPALETTSEADSDATAEVTPEVTP
jgi:sugar lactone lactonase YvrE